VALPVGRLGGLAVAAQVWAHHRVVTGKQWSDTVPGGMRPRMAVQQQHRGAMTAIAHAQVHVAHINLVQPEAVKHVLRSYRSASSATLGQARTRSRAIAHGARLRKNRGTLDTRKVAHPIYAGAGRAA
jgi:hypothetical protein